MIFVKLKSRYKMVASAAILTLTFALAGCSGSSVEGTYEGQIAPSSDEDLDTALEIEQSDDSTLTGILTLDGEEGAGRLTGPEPSGGEFELRPGTPGRLAPRSR